MEAEDLLQRAKVLMGADPAKASKIALESARQSLGRKRFRALRVAASCFNRMSQFDRAEACVLASWLSLERKRLSDVAEIADQLAYIAKAKQQWSRAAIFSKEKIDLLVANKSRKTEILSAQFEYAHILAEPKWHGHNLLESKQITVSVLKELSRETDPALYSMCLSHVIYLRTQDEQDSSDGLLEQVQEMRSLAVHVSQGDANDARCHWLEGLVFRKRRASEESRRHFETARRLFSEHTNSEAFVLASIDQILLELEAGDLRKCFEICGDLFPLMTEFGVERYILLTQLKKTVVENAATVDLVNQIRHRFVSA